MGGGKENDDSQIQVNDGWGDGWGEDEDDEKKPLDVHTRDLNKLDTEELNEVKADMDKDFLKNKIDSKDPNFQYDVRQDFDEAEKVEGSWDEGMVSNDDEDDYFEDDFVN